MIMTFKLKAQTASGQKPRPKMANGMTISEMCLNIMINNKMQSARMIRQKILFKYQENVNLASISSALCSLVLQGKAIRQHRGYYMAVDDNGFI